MSRLLMVTQETETLAVLYSRLIHYGFACSVVSQGNSNGLIEKVAAYRPDLVILETDGPSANARIQQLTQMVKQDCSLPIIALVARDKLDGIDGHLEFDDVLISPYDVQELVVRIERLINRTSNISSCELINCDGLVIDLARCEVTVDSKIVELTFKEYELLKFLAINKGRVYTREALLNKIWGYDYYGGDRTVDVHIRRLRSKVDGFTHSYIETVRNIGYRFRSGKT